MTGSLLENFYSLYSRRRSIRTFETREIEEEKLIRLLEMLRNAQSAANCQPWHFVVLRGEDKARFNEAFSRDGFKPAPQAIVACAEPAKAWSRKTDKKNYAWVDVTIAVTEMIGAATAEGIGTCWVAAFDEKLVTRLLALPDGIEPVGIIVMGYPVEPLERKDKTRKPLSEIIHHGKW